MKAFNQGDDITEFFTVKVTGVTVDSDGDQYVEIHYKGAEGDSGLVTSFYVRPARIDEIVQAEAMKNLLESPANIEAFLEG